MDSFRCDSGGEATVRISVRTGCGWGRGFRSRAAGVADRNRRGSHGRRACRLSEGQDTAPTAPIPAPSGRRRRARSRCARGAACAAVSADATTATVDDGERREQGGAGGQLRGQDERRASPRQHRVTSRLVAEGPGAGRPYSSSTLDQPADDDGGGARTASSRTVCLQPGDPPDNPRGIGVATRPRRTISGARGEAAPSAQGRDLRARSRASAHGGVWPRPLSFPSALRRAGRAPPPQIRR